MRRVAKVAAGLGCLTAVLGPLLGLILYPRAKWLFSFVVIAFIVLWLNHRFAKDPTPQRLADQIERLLMGNYGAYEVDDFEMQTIKSPKLQDLHRRAIAVGGLPEEWITLSEDRKNILRQIISELRTLKASSHHAHG